MATSGHDRRKRQQAKPAAQQQRAEADDPQCVETLHGSNDQHLKDDDQQRVNGKDQPDRGGGQPIDLGEGERIGAQELTQDGCQQHGQADQRQKDAVTPGRQVRVRRLGPLSVASSRRGGITKQQPQQAGGQHTHASLDKKQQAVRIGDQQPTTSRPDGHAQIHPHPAAG